MSKNVSAGEFNAPHEPTTTARGLRSGKRQRHACKEIVGHHVRVSDCDSCCSFDAIDPQTRWKLRRMPARNHSPQGHKDTRKAKSTNANPLAQPQSESDPAPKCATNVSAHEKSLRGNSPPRLEPCDQALQLAMNVQDCVRRPFVFINIRLCRECRSPPGSDVCKWRLNKAARSTKALLSVLQRAQELLVFGFECFHSGRDNQERLQSVMHSICARSSSPTRGV